MTIRCTACQDEITPENVAFKVIYRGKLYCCEDCLTQALDMHECEGCGARYPGAEMQRDLDGRGWFCEACEMERGDDDTPLTRPAQFSPGLSTIFGGTK